MKKSFFLIVTAALMTVPAWAKIPAKITDAFQARYAGATNVEWRHGMGNYQANFNMGDYRIKAKFDRKGNWMESKKMVGKDRLPMTVKNSLRKSKYNQWKIKSSYEEYLPNEKAQYHITAAKGEFKRKNLVFDHRGQLMNG